MVESEEEIRQIVREEFYKTIKEGAIELSKYGVSFGIGSLLIYLLTRRKEPAEREAPEPQEISGSPITFADLDKLREIAEKREELEREKKRLKNLWIKGDLTKEEYERRLKIVEEELRRLNRMEKSIMGT